jgi:4-aminobutyrate aminotransferase-like enzyme
MTTQFIEQPLRTHDFIELENQYGAHNYHPLDVVLERAEGVWVYDVEGKRYLDCLAAYSAVNQGHCHPKILQTLEEQARKVTLTSRAFRNEQLPLLCKELHDLTGFDMVLPMNSGAEAVETAIKTARKWGYKVKGIPEGKAEIIVCANNFHGRTVTIVSFSTDEQYRDGFGPFTPRVQSDSLRRCSCSPRSHHAQHLRLSGRTHSGRGRNRHSSRRISPAKRRKSAARTTCCSWQMKFSLVWDEPASSLPTCMKESRPMS